MVAKFCVVRVLLFMQCPCVYYLRVLKNVLKKNFFVLVENLDVPAAKSYFLFRTGKYRSQTSEAFHGTGLPAKK